MRYKKIPDQYFYFLMNKAAGEVCSMVSDSHKTVYSHFPKDILISNGAKLHSVGRLDCDTEGLLLFTNDGKLSDFLTRPQNHIQKKYFVHLKNKVTEIQQKEYGELAKKGLILPADKKAGKEKSSGADIEWLSDDQCYLTITEGKFHEVKRIFKALGNEVIYLKRVKFADIKLDENLKKGEYRLLSMDEVLKLKNPD